MPRLASSCGRDDTSSVPTNSRRSRRGSLGGYPESFTYCCSRRRAGAPFSTRAWSTGSPKRCPEPRVVATASDLGREAAAIALSIAPGHTAAHCVQGMLYSAAGQLDEAGGAFERALATDAGQGAVHGFAG